MRLFLEWSEFFSPIFLHQYFSENFDAFHIEKNNDFNGMKMLIHSLKTIIRVWFAEHFYDDLDENNMLSYKP